MRDVVRPYFINYRTVAAEIVRALEEAEVDGHFVDRLICDPALSRAEHAFIVQLDAQLAEGKRLNARQSGRLLDLANKHDRGGPNG